MQAVLPASLITLILFLPLAFRLEAFFSLSGECVYFDIKLFAVRLFRKKIFIKGKNLFYFKRFKQYPVVGAREGKAAPYFKMDITEAIKYIGRIKLYADILVTTENPFSGALILASVDNFLGGLSTLGITAGVNSVLNAGSQRIFFKVKIIMNTDFVKIFLTAFSILKKNRRVKNG